MSHLISQIPKSTFWQARLLLTLSGSQLDALPIKLPEDTIHFLSWSMNWSSAVACLPFLLYKEYELNSYKFGKDCHKSKLLSKSPLDGKRTSQ